MIREATETVRCYDEAWAETDRERRLAKLRSVWAPDGVYVDPEIPGGVRGPEAVAAFIEASLEQYPGLEIVSSDLVVLGDRAWYRWTATLPGQAPFDGIDFVEFAEDGRIARLTNFYDL